jgi:hypothetical protein
MNTGIQYFKCGTYNSRCLDVNALPYDVRGLERLVIEHHAVYADN